MKQEVIAIFDIGKTNKKFFLFSLKLKEIYREYASFDEIEDEDGYPTENLAAVICWVKETLSRFLASGDYTIKAVNFSTYGASIVHLDGYGNVLTPLYNYTKPFPDLLRNKFFEKYGPEGSFNRNTGSNFKGMLSTGMQLYLLKQKKPQVFDKIKYSLHLPQYLSYIFTGKFVGEHTTIGCHTALWDFASCIYHNWVYQEAIHKILPEITSTKAIFNYKHSGQHTKIGVGIHDSSSALLPYLLSETETFVLLSTGTWCITLNPFYKGLLKHNDVESGCISYMQPSGKPVKSSSIFLGNEYNIQLKKLIEFYQVASDADKGIRFNKNTYTKLKKSFVQKFKWESITGTPMALKTTFRDLTFEEAYHQLMIELMHLQVKSIEQAMGETPCKKMYIDGGFCDNDVYINLLSLHFPKVTLYVANNSLGSALGAALCVSSFKTKPSFLIENLTFKQISRV